VSALTDAVTAALAPAIQVGVGKQPTRDGTKPWVVIWPDSGVRSAATMKANDGYAETWVCHCWGLTEASARVAERKLADAIYALHTDTVGGRLVQFPEQLSAVPLQRDDAADPPLFNLIAEWRLRTSLAA
jgi:hypothetical protein